MKNILLALSGEAIDQEVIELGCTLARKHKAQVFALYIIEVPQTLPLTATVPEKSEKGELALGQAENLAEKAGCTLQTDLLQCRQAGPAIVDEARERKAELIILGVTYHTRLGEFDLGEAATYVLENAPVKVWLCREEKGEEE
ncbi:MAG: universal stress protein [Chloroflexi bacterium]|nr:universal stress protein [Chloroflexota bacterium]